MVLCFVTAISAMSTRFSLSVSVAPSPTSRHAASSQRYHLKINTTLNYSEKTFTLIHPCNERETGKYWWRHPF